MHEGVMLRREKEVLLVMAMEVSTFCRAFLTAFNATIFIHSDISIIKFMIHNMDILETGRSLYLTDADTCSSHRFR